MASLTSPFLDSPQLDLRRRPNLYPKTKAPLQSIKVKATSSSGNSSTFTGTRLRDTEPMISLLVNLTKTFAKIGLNLLASVAVVINFILLIEA